MPITINGTTGVSGVDGSATTPAFQGTDTNTGMFFPTADTIAFGESGTEAMRINSSGYVGIGTSSPAYTLDVSGTAYFPGTTSSLGAILTDVAEVTTISATAATGTVNYDVTTQSVLYYTINASANWTLNIRGNATTSLNTLMATNQTLTIAFLVTQGATAYYASALTIDGASVTPKYQGGSAWTAGNASGIDSYIYTIIKTGSAAFTVLASQTQFK